MNACDLACDKSLRSIDADGHMRVEESRISKANIGSYLGSEIPRFQELGLDPNRIYRLYRDAEELRKAAPTFEGKPLLIRHVAIDGESPKRELWVGTVGKVTYEHPYLVARPLMVLTKEAIDLIESEEQRELSAAYRYDALMVPGMLDGQRYDGRMLNIRGNHVAIVSEGRAGPDVHVADELPRGLKAMPRLKLIGKLLPFLRSGADLLALDETLRDIGETPEKSVMTLSKDERRRAEDEAREEKREREGEDAELTDEEREEAYERARDRKAKDKKAKDKKAKDAKRARDAEKRGRSGEFEAEDEEDDEDEEAEDERDEDEEAEDEEEPEESEEDEEGEDAAHRDIGMVKGKDRRRGRDSPHGRDSRRARDRKGAKDAERDHRKDFEPRAKDSVTKDELNTAVKRAREQMRDEMQALSAAREAVRPIVGQVSMACDSAEKVYRFALDELGINTKGVPPDMYGTLLEVHQNASRRAGKSSGTEHAMDGSTVTEFDSYLTAKRRA